MINVKLDKYFFLIGVKNVKNLNLDFFMGFNVSLFF